MNKTFIVAFLILHSGYLFCQMVEFGIGFTPYDMSVSTSYKVEFKSDDETLKKILNYFYPDQGQGDKIRSTENEIKSTSTETKSTDEYFVIEGTTAVKFQDIKKLFVGFGKSEIIRLFIIKQKSDTNPSLKELVKEYNKLRSWNKLAQKYKLDYMYDVWLPSKEIYTKLFEVKEDEKEH